MYENIVSVTAQLIIIWNSLPENVIKSENINVFKNALDRLWISKCYDYTNENNEIHVCKIIDTERVHTGIKCLLPPTEVIR